MHFETVIGLEVHVELKTDSKMFSPSPAHFGAEPNSNTNVIDLAYPGVLPVVNKRAVDWAMRCLLYTSPSPRDATLSRMPSSA